MPLSRGVIPIRPVTAGAPAGGALADAILAEIASALHEYLDTRQNHVIDLTGMPLSREDRQRIDAYLGQGEVSMDIHALVHSHIEETAYAGVWRVRHYDMGGGVHSERIEIIDVPEIVRASSADMAHSARRIEALRAEEGA
ncbi:hydrogenase expression/formation C-terminal domain-containing protein [Acidiferrobacter sp.]|uniref:hydrogenase expression/formation C-terminal domain-containing protein n=1 Tax=Acidiferrobacter sp. TaxID=1872107 RepID=UPI0026246DE1|nr:hydrogenase expression/formation C-terminal domain-containing protein [Acidiferrobacter sp.]